MYCDTVLYVQYVCITCMYTLERITVKVMKYFWLTLLYLL